MNFSIEEMCNIKKVNGKLSLFIISMLLVLVACSDANNEVAPSPTPAPTPTVEVKEAVVEEVVEELNEPISYLQNVQKQLKSVETISYMSSVAESYYFYSNDTNTLASTTDYVYSMNGELRRSPAAAKVDATASFHVLEYDENGNNTFEDYDSSDTTNYMSNEDGLYFNSEDKWHQYNFNEPFKTIEHIEKVVDLFVLNLEELAIIDGFGEGNDPNLAVIQYNLTNEQFVDISQDFIQSFFTGVYDLTDTYYEAPKVEDMYGMYLDITVDKDFNIYSYTISYSDKYVYDEIAHPDDFHAYSLTVYFNGVNEQFFSELPEEVRKAAITN